MAEKCLIILVLFAVFVGIIAQCPPSQLIVPCNCSSEFIPLVQCGNINDMEVLVQVFKRSGDRKFTSFVLFDSSLMYLPATAISVKEFQQLLIINALMSALFDTAPEPNNKVSMIILMNVHFQRGVGWELFANLKGLEFFRTENTEIKSLGKSFVDNMSHGLTNLILQDSKIRKIQYNAFQNMDKLFDIEITNSFIKQLRRSMFSTPSAIEELDFSGNQISSLPDDLFSNMPVLEKVKLNRNKISVVSEAVFGNVFHHLSQMNLEDNPLNCDCTLKWYISKGGKILNGKCEEPEDKKGRSIGDLTKKDYNYC